MELDYGNLLDKLSGLYIPIKNITTNIAFPIMAICNFSRTLTH